MALSPFSANSLIAAPDYDQVNQGSNVALVDALRLIWNSLQSEITDRKRQRFQWNDATYSSSLFSASAGTWTVSSGSMLVYKYVVENDLCLLQFNFHNTSTSAGMGTELRVLLPAGFKVVNANATIGTGQATTSGGATINETFYITSFNTATLSFQRSAAASWPNGMVSTLNLMGSVILQVVV